MSELSQGRARLLGRLRARKSRTKERRVLVEGIRAAAEAVEAGVSVDFAVVSPRLGRSGQGADLRTALIEVEVVEVTDTVRPGHITLPNGLGVDYPSDRGDEVTGVPTNELTSLGHQDEFAGTPWHKHVPARLEPLQTA